MKIRVFGSNAHEGEPYYLRDEFEIEQALHDGFRIFQGENGHIYGNPTGRCAFGGWTGYAVPEPHSSDTTNEGARK